MNTPWGASDGTYCIAEGVTGVNTPSHGGILVDVTRFDLDKRLRGGLFTRPYGTVVPFEEDCDVPALLYAHPDLLPAAIRAGYLGDGVTMDMVRRSVERNHPTLLRDWCLHCGSDTCEHAARHNAAYGKGA